VGGIAVRLGWRVTQERRGAVSVTPSIRGRNRSVIVDLGTDPGGPLLTNLT